jgi:hypothetical protein
MKALFSQTKSQPAVQVTLLAMMPAKLYYRGLVETSRAIDCI